MTLLFLIDHIYWNNLKDSFFQDLPHSFAHSRSCIIYEARQQSFCFSGKCNNIIRRFRSVSMRRHKRSKRPCLMAETFFLVNRKRHFFIIQLDFLLSLLPMYLFFNALENIFFSVAFFYNLQWFYIVRIHFHNFRYFLLWFCLNNLLCEVKWNSLLVEIIFEN